jgi:uroporphyrinogen-III decarboxylase
MNRKLLLDLAASGHAVPIGTDLVLQEKTDPEKILNDGRLLGGVIEESAARYSTPLAIPLMDLKIEKAALLEALGIPELETERFHFDRPVSESEISAAALKIRELKHRRMAASAGAVRFVADRTKLLPVGMCIGPFSLTTKLMADPITAVYLKADGMTADDEPSIALLDSCLELSVRAIMAYLEIQVASGAKAVIMCEPAANRVYFSPNQLREGRDIFDACVIDQNRRIKDLLDKADVDLIYHDCGELEDVMVRKIVSLHPSMLSLGSSRRLWEDARLVPKDVVLYGNMPTKQFHSDDVMPLARVSEAARGIAERMKAAGHPFILGSECDVLSVPGKEAVIKAKVEAFMGCSCR